MNKKLLLPLWCRHNVNLFRKCVKLIAYLASAVKVVSSNPCIGPLPRIKVCLCLLSICTDELISAPKIIKKESAPKKRIYLNQHF